MSLKVKQYPSGVRTLPEISIGDARASKVYMMNSGDPELVEVIRRMQLVRVANATSLDKLNIIKCAKRLFGDFDKFVTYNIMYNDVYNGIDLDFLIDTVEFINGGVRSMEVHTWASILTQEEKKISTVNEHTHVSLPTSGHNYIGKWLRQPNGLEDMVSTLAILFGIKSNSFVKSNGLI